MNPASRLTNTATPTGIKTAAAPNPESYPKKNALPQQTILRRILGKRLEDRNPESIIHGDLQRACINTANSVGSHSHFRPGHFTRRDEGNNCQTMGSSEPYITRRCSSEPYMSRNHLSMSLSLSDNFPGTHSQNPKTELDVIQRERRTVPTLVFDREDSDSGDPANDQQRR